MLNLKKKDANIKYSLGLKRVQSKQYKISHYYFMLIICRNSNVSLHLVRENVIIYFKMYYYCACTCMRNGSGEGNGGEYEQST